ncbi:hypothetical protein [Nitratiruptor sp. YY09-18]|uniref:hypothetical protein n=1 Tax=Nitratiruptor sp. YY09-18 TaxID=2724901 RepID=UPI0019155C49|nr:hypothetical protein [Nitratiruptor sp. YY09-18]BCD67742.1 hypothetical protein NitYY0918_C0649 [Nitratiruptor sp. YY09-18]
MDLEKLKNDKEFLDNLQKEKSEALKYKNIVKMYDVLDTMLALDLEDEEIDTLYQNILEVAFDRLAQMLADAQKFDFAKDEDLYIARAIYEHAIERWDQRDFKGASELFLILSVLVPEDFQEAMLLPMAATAQKMELDDFIQKFVKKEEMSEESIFLDKFTDNAKEFMQKSKDLIDQELKKVKKLA